MFYYHLNFRLFIRSDADSHFYNLKEETQANECFTHVGTVNSVFTHSSFTRTYNNYRYTLGK